MNTKRFFLVTALFMAMVPFEKANAQSLSSLIAKCEEVSSNQEISEANAALMALKNTKFIGRDSVIQRGEKCLTFALGVDTTFIDGQGFLTVDEHLAAERARLLAEEAEERARLLAKEAEERARLLAKEAEERARFLAEKEAELVRARVCELRGLVRQYDKTISEAEAARQDRRIETLSATTQECSSWFNESPRQALTNDVCNSIFAASGLPNSTITGPSMLEEIIAESAGLLAKQELEAVVSSGMLIEDYMAKYGSEKEEADSYNCSE